MRAHGKPVMAARSRPCREAAVGAAACAKNGPVQTKTAAPGGAAV